MIILDWLYERLSEESTWRGIILVLTGLGVKIAPDLANSIISLGLGAVGVVLFVKKQSASKRDVATAVNAATADVPKAIVIDEKTMLPK